MNITKKMEDAINAQINAEMYSGYLYMSMSTYFESVNLKGCAHWMKAQAAEEWKHAMKFYDYVFQRGGTVILSAIAAPKNKWESPLAIFQEAYNHELKVTGLIHDLVKLSGNEGDIATQSFLKWYVDEQVEEEASANEIVQKLKMIGNALPALMVLDHELGKRGK
jgi:ferritin